VQATRAGADYGLGLSLVIIIACLIKYPSIRFGGDYAAATGTSLISSYRKEGWWAFSIYAFAQLFSMAFMIAAISLFALGLLKATLGFEVSNILGCVLLLGVMVAFLLSGKYHLLEKLTKYLVVILTLLIFSATVLVVPRVDWSPANFAFPTFSPQLIFYLVALVGFMPTPSDASVLTSVWACAKSDCEGRRVDPDDTRLDFNIGYIGSTVLALCFLILGAGVMHRNGVVVDPSNGGFATQLIELFTSTIGGWSFPLIATSAVFVILSTLLTVLDGMTRIAVGIVDECRVQTFDVATKQKAYSIGIVILCTASVFVIGTMMKSFATFLDITSIIVFIISPLLAFLNHRAITSKRVAVELQPSKSLRLWSLCSAWFLTVLTLIYFYVRLT